MYFGMYVHDCISLFAWQSVYAVHNLFTSHVTTTLYHYTAPYYTTLHLIQQIGIHDKKSANNSAHSSTTRRASGVVLAHQVLCIVLCSVVSCCTVYYVWLQSVADRIIIDNRQIKLQLTTLCCNLFPIHYSVCTLYTHYIGRGRDR